MPASVTRPLSPPLLDINCSAVIPSFKTNTSIFSLTSPERRILKPLINTDISTPNFLKKLFVIPSIIFIDLLARYVEKPFLPILNCQNLIMSISSAMGCKRLTNSSICLPQSAMRSFKLFNNLLSFFFLFNSAICLSYISMLSCISFIVS